MLFVIYERIASKILWTYAIFQINLWAKHYQEIVEPIVVRFVKSVRIQSFSGPNTDSEYEYGHFLRSGIQSSVKYLKWSFLPKIVTGFQLLNIFAKSIILDVWHCCEDAFEIWKSRDCW